MTNQMPGRERPSDELEALTESWERRARAAFRSADRYEQGSIERRFIEHGAMCYFNCCEELRVAIQSGALPRP